MPDDANLLSAVRNYLDITWDNPDDDEKLQGIIARGKHYLDTIAGTTLDYEKPGHAQGLLFNYCRYERSNALEEFQPNYRHELVTLYLSGGGASDEKTGTDIQ